MKKNPGNKKNSKKKKIVALAALALLAAGAGTFAWMNSQDARINRVSSAAIKDGSVTVEESFEPKPIIAGTKTKKEVNITNSGSAPAFVRVSYEEVLKYLTSKGQISEKAAGWKAAEKPSLSDDVPLEYNGSKYTDAKSGYTNITSKVKLGTSALPNGVLVYAKGNVTKDPLTGALSRNFNPVVFYEYAQGKYQSMTATVEVTSPMVEGVSVDTWEFVMKDGATYSVYADGYQNTAINWANSTLEGASPEATKIHSSLLGSSGKKYDVDYNYTAEALKTTLPSTATPATDASQFPVNGKEQKGIQADKNVLGKNGIQIEYDDFVVSMDKLVGDESKDKWVYNKDDGYFYYTSPLASGKTTNGLLKSLVFSNSIDTSYTNATYDLIVKMEAVQATTEALTDDQGWKLDQKQEGTKKVTDYLAAQATQS